MSQNVLAVTRAAWAVSAVRTSWQRNPLMDTFYAAADQRDRFLNALDAQDIELCRRLASDLSTCANALPGMTCEQLGLSPGSTYGCAARSILAKEKS